MADAISPPGHAELGRTELAALLRIHQAASAPCDRASLLAALAESLRGVLPADRIALALPEEALAEGSPFARAIRARAPLAVADPEPGLASGAIVPLLARGDCLGAIGFFARAPGAWDGFAPGFLDEIGASLAPALERCLSHEQQQRMQEELGALLDVNRAVGRHLERDELFGALAASLRTLIETDRFGIELPIEGGRLQGHLLTPRGPGAEPTVPTILPAPGTACDWVLQKREWLVSDTREALRERFPITYQVMSQERMESLVAMPLETGKRCRGVLFFMAARPGAYRQLRRGLLEQVASAVAVALDDCLAHEEVRRLRDRLAAENRYLQEEIREEQHFGDIVGESPALRQVLALVAAAAPTSATVLILGETGTGKELIARALHDASARRDRPLVKVNCAAISAGLVESELFGHVKGAFTGALANHSGRFELADGGSIFLDEIGELPLETQGKLLRVLQEREFEPVGSSQTRRVDVRVIAATSRDLEQEVAAGRFRSDLFFRLNVVQIRVPPLRERREDARLLAHFFVDRFARELGKPIDAISAETTQRLLAYDWPGNVRELQNVIERGMVLARGRVLELPPELLGGPAPAAERAQPPQSLLGARSAQLSDVAREHMLLVLERCGWVIDGAQGAARSLGLSPSTLRSRMKRLGIERPAPAS